MHDSKVRSRLKAQLSKFTSELCGGQSKPLTKFGKRQTNACFAAHAAGVSSATRWTDAFASSGKMSTR